MTDDKVKIFIDRNNIKSGGMHISSTGARLVDYPGVLYNVTGSKEDPSAVPGYKGATWTTLMNGHGDFRTASCYVTNSPAAEGSTHPQFLVGGHMTPEKSGVVEDGGVTYLMPLCKWHNSIYRNEVAFEHKETRMVMLTGYMKDDTPETYAARLGMVNKSTLLYLDLDSNIWKLQDLNEHELNSNSDAFKIMSANLNFEDYAIFEKQGNSFKIEDWHI